MKKIIETENAMEAFAAELAHRCTPGIIIGLYGDLGAGKTVFCRGFLRALGYEGPVKSPTYTLIESYEVQGLIIHHVDLYRIAHPDELFFIGITEILNHQSIALIEWPERGAGVLPVEDIACYIDITEAGREVRLVGESERGRAILMYYAMHG